MVDTAPSSGRLELAPDEDDEPEAADEEEEAEEDEMELGRER